MYKELVNLIERQYDQEIMKGLNRLPPKKRHTNNHRNVYEKVLSITDHRFSSVANLC